MSVQLIQFKNFSKISNGTIITNHNNKFVVYTLNPYGGYNIVLVEKLNENFSEAYKHGTKAVLGELQGTKAYKKVIKYLSKKKAECLYKHFGLNYTRTREETLEKHGVKKVTLQSILHKAIAEQRLNQVIENYIGAILKVS
jgi:tRNA(His) 5'-end guanylyltransferase